jgi:hypothetical protein|nr:MAG TPA: Magi 5 toxic peptide family [Caudoviricetes sp.]
MAECKQCCGTCKYGLCVKTNGYVCSNDESDYAADLVEYIHSCDFWEQKQGKRK